MAKEWTETRIQAHVDFHCGSQMGDACCQKKKEILQ